MISKSLPLLVVVAVVGLVGLFALNSPVAAQQQDIERSFSQNQSPISQVSPGQEFTVTISNLGLGATGGIGNVKETVPDGFTYVTGSTIVLSPSDSTPVIEEPTIDGREHDFFMLGVDSFRYKVSVDDDAAAGRRHFDGVLVLFGNRQVDILGADEVNVVVQAPTPEPTPTSEPTPEPTPTSEPSAYSRSLPSGNLEPGDEFDVTISGLGLGAAGGLGTVEETLPSGFTYVSGSVAVDSGGNGAVINASANGRAITFTMVAVDSFSYKAMVGSGVGDGSHGFSGDFINFANVRTSIGGDTSVSVEAPEPPDTGLNRSFPSAQIDAGDNVTVTISGLGLGAAGGLGTVEETLPSEVTFVSGSQSVDSGGNGAVINASANGQTITFTMVAVDSFTYGVTVGADVADGTYRFSGDFINFANVRTAIGGDASLRVGPLPTATPVPTATPEPTATPVPDDGTPTPATRTPRPTAVPPAPPTPVVIEKVDVTEVEGATTVQPDASVSVSSADGMATVMLPNTSRARTYQVMVSTDDANCSGAPARMLACATVNSYDAEGNAETDVELIRRATVVMTLDSAAVEDLGGLPVVFQANALGAFSVRQVSAEGNWTSRRSSMGLTEDGGVMVTVTGLRHFGSIALSVDEDILQTAYNQVMGITPTPVVVPPTPEPTAVPEPTATAVPEDIDDIIVGDATAPVGLLIVLALTGALMVYTGARVMRGRRSAVR